MKDPALSLIMRARIGFRCGIMSAEYHRGYDRQICIVKLIREIKSGHSIHFWNNRTLKQNINRLTFNVYYLSHMHRLNLAYYHIRRNRSYPKYPDRTTGKDTYLLSSHHFQFAQYLYILFLI